MIEGTYPADLQDLPTTKGIERRSRRIDGIEIVFWDLAGQSLYRSSYFKNPQVFSNTSILIYVIDIQDADRFDESLEYFMQILMTIKNFSTPPKIFSLLHKYDPDKLSELKSRLSEASKLVEEVNKIPLLKIKNYSTSIYANTMELIFGKMIQELIPDFIVSSQPLTERAASSVSNQILSEINISEEVKNEVNIDDLRLQMLNQLENAEEISSNPNYQKAVKASVNFTEFHEQLSEVMTADSASDQEKTSSQIVDPLMVSLLDQIETKQVIAVKSGLLNKDEIELLDKFKSFMELLKSKLSSIVEELDLNSYEVIKKLPILFEGFITKIINEATINRMITAQERSSLNQIITKLTFKV